MEFPDVRLSTLFSNHGHAKIEVTRLSCFHLILPHPL